MKLLNILNKNNKNLHKKLFSTSVKNLKVYDNVDNFNDLINRTDGKPLLVDFTAQWLVCPPCKLLGPLLESKSNHDSSLIDLIKVDVDENMNLAKEWQVTSMPTVIAFKNGKPISKFIGLINDKELSEFISYLNKA